MMYFFKSETKLLKISGKAEQKEIKVYTELADGAQAMVGRGTIERNSSYFLRIIVSPSRKGRITFSLVHLVR